MKTTIHFQVKSTILKRFTGEIWLTTKGRQLRLNCGAGIWTGAKVVVLRQNQDMKSFKSLYITTFMIPKPRIKLLLVLISLLWFISLFSKLYVAESVWVMKGCVLRIVYVFRHQSNILSKQAAGFWVIVKHQAGYFPPRFSYLGKLSNIGARHQAPNLTLVNLIAKPTSSFGGCCRHGVSGNRFPSVIPLSLHRPSVVRPLSLGWPFAVPPLSLGCPPARIDYEKLKTKGLE